MTTALAHAHSRVRSQREKYRMSQSLYDLGPRALAIFVAR
jgi:hypothetical protein